MAQSSDDTVESKEARGAALNRQIRPLSLRLDAQMRSTFFESHFNAPALDEIQDDGEARLVLIGREVHTDRPGAHRISTDHPADRQGRLTSSIPQSGSTAPFHDGGAAIIPLHF